MGRAAVARIDAEPAVWHALPHGLAAELGWTIAGFGHLEDMLKRAIFAMDRRRLPGNIGDADFRAWLRRMDHVAADSLGTLIERMERTLARENIADGELMARLDEIKSWRNLLCHAAWSPVGSGWQPRYANTQGEVFEDILNGDDLATIRKVTLDAAGRVARFIVTTGDEEGATD